MKAIAESERLNTSEVTLRPPKRVSERRRHVRFATDDPARMRIVEPHSGAHWTVPITDVSKGGMRLAVPTPLAKGRLIQIQMKDTCVLAKVRYCRSAPTKSADMLFHAGVEIQRVF